MKQPSPRVSALVNLGALTALLGVVIVGFAASFDGLGYLIPAVGGLVLGLVIAVVAARRRWGAVSVAGLVALAIAVFGGALALPRTTLWGVPTIETLSELAVGLIAAWKTFVTSAAPMRWDEGHGLVPFYLLLVSAALAGSLALRLRSGAWALIPVIAAFVLQAALGVATTVAPITQGVALAVIAVGWLGYRYANDPSRLVAEVHGETTVDAVHGARSRRLLAGGVVLALAAGAGVTLGMTTPDVQRSVLRDDIVPPLDIRAYTSPLQSFRAYVRDDAESAQFTLTGMPPHARVRLATLDAYTGTVLNVAGDSGTFLPLRTDRTEKVEGASATVTIEVGDYDGSFVPTVGDVANLAFAGADAAALGRASYLNADTGTVITTRPLVRGDVYTVTTGMREEPSPKQLETASFADVTRPEQVGVPDAITTLATDLTAEAKTPLGQVTALRDWLVSEGYFSHGLAGDAPSLSGHGAVRLQELLQNAPITGDDEQYAVAMVLLADRLGIPARAVMGWHDQPDDAPATTFTARGDNLHVWVEVAFDGYGWVPFDVTPPEDKKPVDEAPQPRSDTRPQVLQPPPADQDAADDPLAVPESRDPQDEDEDDKDAAAGLTLPIIIALGAGSLLLVLLLPVLIIVLLKARRRRQRARSGPADRRVAGAWDEVVDRARDLRVPLPSGVSRQESAQSLSQAFPDAEVITLARRADARVFGPGEATEDDVGRFWADTDDVIHGMMHSRSRRSRISAKISLRSLLRARGDGPMQKNNDGGGGEGERS